MASTSCVMAQSAAASSVSFTSQQQQRQLSSHSSFIKVAGVKQLPAQRVSFRRSAVSTRASSQKPESAEPAKEGTGAEATELNAAAAAAVAAPKPKPAPAPRNPSFRDVMAFSGPAPETINGRLAMLGFLSAVAVEATSGDALAAQLGDGQGVKWFLVASALISAASLVPMLKGVTRESVSGSIMSAKAEMWNGRAAMLGLVALGVTEFLKHGPLV